MTSKRPDIVDIDAAIGDDLAKSQASIGSVPIKVFGETFRVLNDINTFLLLQVGGDDAAAIAKMMVSLIHEDDRAAFKGALGRQRGLTAEILLKVFDGMMEAATNHPTQSSPGSSSGSNTNTGSANSVVKSSARRAVVSKRSLPQQT
jgi:hypothetical protein